MPICNPRIEKWIKGACENFSLLELGLFLMINKFCHLWSCLGAGDRQLNRLDIAKIATGKP